MKEVAATQEIVTAARQLANMSQELLLAVDKFNYHSGIFWAFL